MDQPNLAGPGKLILYRDPIDGTNLLRIAFYLLLPPLTWVGAALVENVVELFLV